MLCSIMLQHSTLFPALPACVSPNLAWLPCHFVGYTPLLQSVSASLMDGHSSIWYCLDEVMDASLLSPAAWSQNTEELVKRWLIFPNSAACCKQDFGHHVFISLNQSPHYLRLGNWLFVMEERFEDLWCVNCIKSAWRRKRVWSLPESRGKELKLLGGPEHLSC